MCRLRTPKRQLLLPAATVPLLPAQMVERCGFRAIWLRDAIVLNNCDFLNQGGHVQTKARVGLPVLRIGWMLPGASTDEI